MIRHGYQIRDPPEYFVDAESREEVLHQPEVYICGADVASVLGAGQVIDLGCGRGDKLAPLAERYSVVGIDYGPNIQWCRETHGFGTWIEHDLDIDGELEVDPSGSVVICADVIEHVRCPSILADKLRALLAGGAVAAVISTPERHVTHGIWHDGPPSNPAHVREWTIRELSAFLRRAGLANGTIGLTRNNTRDNVASTILGAYVAYPQDLRKVEDVLIDSPRPPQPAPRLPLSTVERLRAGLAKRIGP
jgi:SAM-dependent methyltransferase